MNSLLIKPDVGAKRNCDKIAIETTIKQPEDEAISSRFSQPLKCLGNQILVLAFVGCCYITLAIYKLIYITIVD